MAKKFDYQKNVITIDEAMEMLGLTLTDLLVPNNITKLIVEATGVILEATGQKAEGSTFYPVWPQQCQNHSRTIPEP